ncbi:LysR substrate-binding domain-containing protein [Novispirillum itersonii]|uniref:LysR family glycine cleavage system transcriptional activator n=1 Tax=Novispirillum itersonii TaxID=189 RepID=A0A7W9ZEU9_NOVIT|nr:LysR substrate-binding domain-containing protein [Novispirillum itersonii]MBB6208719.1 LysR family glycine cleavage system transcriptional activator [Novispirillum itersonii]
MRSSPTLPPLPALRAFEAVGRALSFRKAGEDLLISQSAVSHHIARLEADLGVTLFIRHARGVTFTPDGERYFQAVTAAFSGLAAATAALRPAAARPLRLSVLPAFARIWLVPRLADWTRRAPETGLDINSTLAVADVAGGEADIAIRYGSGPWPGVSARLLLPERLAPVISPTLAARGPVLTAPADLLRHTLLTNLRPSDWQSWAASTGLDLSTARWLQLTDYTLVMQAAQDGLGVAMGRLELLSAPLATGALRPALPDLPTVPGAGYWLVTARGGTPHPARARFLRWISGQPPLA